ncbi:MAG: TonB-dependent receptor [Bacteroidales bacterium]|nr:TonB-dependent receptor [Bacteroidales bacterium]
MKKIYWIFSALLLPFSNFAQTEKDTMTVDITNIEVIKKATSIASESLRIVTTLTRNEIQEMPVQSINDLLDYLPGIDVRSRGTNGVQADMTMRGGTFDQVIILLNGVNITDPQTGHQNLDIPIDLSIIDRIEILQGTSMNVFGLSAFSGAINIVTGTQKDNKISVGLTGGSNGYFAPHASITASNEKWSVAASASTNQSSGYIENTDFNYTNVYVQTKYKSSKAGDFSFQLGGQNKEFGANSFYSTKYPNQFEKDKTILSSLQWDKNIGKINLSASGFYRTHYDEFQLFRDKSIAPSWYKNANYHISQLSGANCKIATYSRIGKSTIGIEARNEHIVSNVLGDPLESPKNIPFAKEDSVFFTYEKNRLNINYFGEQTFLFGKFTASLGFSGNYNTMFNSNVCGGGNLSYRLSRNSRIYTNINTALRLPTFTDMYYKSATQLANPDLQPEKSLTMELGTQGNSENFSYRASAYYRIGKDIIDWAKKADDEVWQSMNIDNVNALGTEISLQYRFDSFLKQIGTTYAFCKLNKESGELISKYALDYLRNTFTITIDHTIYKNWGANWQFSVQDRIGNYIDTNDNVTDYKPFSLLDLQTYWNNDNTKIFLEASNILGTKYFDYGGIEQPGLQVRVGINVQFGL